MEITTFVASHREQALLLGDYNSYRAQLSRRLLSLRKKLGRASAKGKKYAPPSKITGEEIERNHEFAHLILLISERAWAHAMYLKTHHSTGSAASNGITGTTRKHIISRMHKAAVHARELYTTLDDRSGSSTGELDALEARAYSSSLDGAEQFERGRWDECLASYSEARVIYSALLTSTKKEVFKDVMSSNVDPSIRYAAYQSRIPRSLAIPAVARRHFPQSDENLTSTIKKLDPDALRTVKPSSAREEGTVDGADPAPQTITWRSRTVDIEDASIASALGAVSTASEKLSELLSSSPSHELSAKDRALAYDELLIACQDTVDATRDAIEELSGEGVGQTDKRMQALQITRTAVMYDLLSWRIGRNRVLTGEQDGMNTGDGDGASRRPKRAKQEDEIVVKEEGKPKKLAKLTEKVVLYGSTLQSIDSIRELPGVAADEPFVKELQDKKAYFEALKTLSIARSHDLLSSPKNALALFSHASSALSPLSPSSFSSSPDSTSLLSLEIDPSNLHNLHRILQGETARHRALAEIDVLNASKSSPSSTSQPPLVENLNTYPAHGVDLNNLVTYPPKVQPIPVKPLFLDVAWNYVEYPGRKTKETTAAAAKPSGKEHAEKGKEQEQGQGKKGWFGFGR